MTAGGHRDAAGLRQEAGDCHCRDPLSGILPRHQEYAPDKWGRRGPQRTTAPVAMGSSFAALSAHASPRHSRLLVRFPRSSMRSFLAADMTAGVRMIWIAPGARRPDCGQQRRRDDGGSGQTGEYGWGHIEGSSDPARRRRSRWVRPALVWAGGVPECFSVRGQALNLERSLPLGRC